MTDSNGLKGVKSRVKSGEKSEGGRGPYRTNDVLCMATRNLQESHLTGIIDERLPLTFFPFINF